MANLQGIQNYKECIEKHFSYLKEQYGAKLIPSDDNKVLVYKLKKSLVRFVLDRKQLFVSIRSVSVDEWFDLSIIILTKEPASDFKYLYLDKFNFDNEIKNMSNLLMKYGNDLLDGDFLIENAYKETGLRRWKQLEERYKK